MTNQRHIPIIVICGSTGTGKTSLALKLCQEFGGEIISADSRQVYQGMDIGTGKESNKDHVVEKHRGYWMVDGIPIYLYDQIKPNEEFSISHFRKLALEHIQRMVKKGKTPFLVGGTGFYLKSVFEKIKTIEVKPDQNLRRRLEGQLEEEGFEVLVKELKDLDPKAAQRIDLKNPRRVVRAIEIILNQPLETLGQDPSVGSFDPLWIGLRLDRKKLYPRVDQRIDQMVEAGLTTEIESLLKKGYAWDLPSMSGIGYRQFRPYFEDRVELKECIQKLKWDTHAYIRRQETWFKKQKGIVWFDIDQENFQKQIEEVLKNWKKSK